MDTNTLLESKGSGEPDKHEGDDKSKICTKNDDKSSSKMETNVDKSGPRAETSQVEKENVTNLTMTNRADEVPVAKTATEIELDETLCEETSRKNEEVMVSDPEEEKQRENAIDRSLVDASQATTVDITEIDPKAAHSQDLFASQMSQDIATMKCNAIMDYEEFEPQFQSTENSQKSGEEKTVISQSQLGVGTVSRKRKFEELAEVPSDFKIPKVQTPLASSSTPKPPDTDNSCKPTLASSSEDVTIIDQKGVSDARKDVQMYSETDPFMEEDTQTLTPLETKSDKDETVCQKTEETVESQSQESVVSKEKVTKSEQTLEPCKSDSAKEDSQGTEVVSDGKMVSKEATSLGSDKSKVTDKHSKSPRESIEVVFSSLPKESRNRGGQDALGKILEENGDGYESQEDDFCLRLSVSPSQITPSKDTAEICNTSQLPSSVSEKSRQNCGDQSIVSQSNSLSTTRDSKLSSEWNSHSSNDSAAKHTSSSAGLNNDEVEILSPERKKPEKVGVNGSSHLDTNDVTLVEVVPGWAVRGGTVSHKDMNGTPSKRKQHTAARASEGVVVLDSEGDGWGGAAQGEQRKRSRGLQLPTADDDMPPLRKMKDSPAVPTQLFEMTITVQYKLRAVAHANDKTQVFMCEPLECREIEDCIDADFSSGNAADVSKNSSPSSVTSLGPFTLGPFTLRPPLSRSSTSTSSSGTSSLSGYSLAGSRSRTNFDSDTLMMPAPLSRVVRERHRTSDSTDDFEKSDSALDVAKRNPIPEACQCRSAAVLRSIVRQKLLAEKQHEKAPRTSKSPAAALQAGTSLPEESEAPAAGNDAALPKTEQVVQETERIVDTPKSTKKSRPPRVRNASRSASVRTIKEVKEEEKSGTPAKVEESQQQTEGASSESRRMRRTPLRQRRGGPSANSALEGKTTPSSATRSGTPIATPNRTRRNRSEVVENSQHTYEWTPEDSKLKADAPVFARWTDKKYYSGKIKEKCKDGRWMILFDDGNSKSLKEEFIVAVNILAKGQSVFAQEGEDCEQGLIVEFQVKAGEVLYGVDLDSGNKSFYPRSKLFMTEDQARLLQETMCPKLAATSSPALTTTVTCDNIVQHKRPRSNRVLFGAESESPSVSGVTKTSHRRTSKGDSTYDNSCSSSVSDSNDKSSNLVLEEVGGVDPEAQGILLELLPTPSCRGKGPGRIKNKSRTPRRNQAANHLATDSEEEHRRLLEILGPIPEKNSNIFHGTYFLLTHTHVRPKTAAPKPSSQDLQHSEEETSANEDANKTPFVKEYLRQQIEAGGGKVCDHFEDLPESEYSNCFLVSDQPCLTAKYIQCLANGIKIINCAWIACQAKGMNDDWLSVRMPPGWSLEDKCFVETGMKTRKKSPPLSKKEVGLVNDSQAFIKFWGQILTKMGATVQHIAPEQDCDIQKMNVIVTDSSCPPEVQERAREWGIPLVSTVWVTQSLITGKAREFDAHLHYRFDYCGSD